MGKWSRNGPSSSAVLARIQRQPSAKISVDFYILSDSYLSCLLVFFLLCVLLLLLLFIFLVLALLLLFLALSLCLFLFPACLSCYEEI